jgi:hypothetical protein
VGAGHARKRTEWTNRSVSVCTHKVSLNPHRRVGLGAVPRRRVSSRRASGKRAQPGNDSERTT